MQSLRHPLFALAAVALAWTTTGCGDTYSVDGNNNANLNNAADCDGGGCIGDKVPGEVCLVGDECASGYCPAADGVCCSAACDGKCIACVESKTGQPDGTCGTITENTDPDSECGDEGASSCGADGSGCNGDAASPGCNRYDDTTICADGTCTLGLASEVRYCDGLGNCEASGTSDCAPYACDAAGVDCLTGCTGHGDCDTANYCDGNGDCVPRHPDGTTCTDDGECTSSFCVDAVCCNRVCDATCEACSAAGTGGVDGVCGPVTVDTDPDGECPSTDPTSCGVDGSGCNGDSANPGCNLYDNATLCSAASCTGGVLTNQGWCDGNGTCSTASQLLCAPYSCNVAGTGCETSCASQSDCDAATSYCDAGGACVPKILNGSACISATQCVSGFCPASDGVCCNAACDATCEACAAAKTGLNSGVCGPVSTSTDPDAECGATAPSTCGAAGTGCNGNGANPDCFLYDNTTVCATAGCTAGVYGGDGLCDSAGNCAQGTPVVCDPFVCDAAGTACLTTCGAQSDCMAGTFCDGTGVCQPKLNDGVVCADGFQCLSGSCPTEDGVCCDTSCDTSCVACLAAKTGGVDGTCGPVTAGTDLDNECGADVCSGGGACRCADGQLNGAETDIDCGGGVCADCSPGQTCIANSDCTSGNCPSADGVCCDTPCDSTCVACVAAKTGGVDGTCGPVTAGTDPDTDCAADVCNGFGACRCVDGLLNGAETDTDCGGGICATCAGGLICASDGDCASGNCPADDNVCCDAACTGLCESCLAANTGTADGTCDLVLTDTDPDGDCGISETCDVTGACYDPCPTNGCLVDADCTPGATGDLCVDPADDCMHATCEGATPGTLVESGAPMTEDLTSWQSGEDETARGGGRWYCNATLPVTAAGVLTNWELFVHSHYDNGDEGQFMVIRCTSGGGGGGPALSGCTRVGLGPVQVFAGNGLFTGTLAGSTQLDGAPADPTGIVVQAGDIICADAERFELGVDCNGSATAGGCPGPDYNTQQLANMDTTSEPFGIADSGSDGTLMVKAYGTTPSTPGICADDTPEPDTTLCTEGGGDTCCGGNCITGPSGAGTCL